MKELINIFFTFFKIGILTFGGGYSMLPLLEREIVERTGWATKEELLDYFAIGQCTPGIIAVNTATLVGYTQRGFWGSLFATVGIVTPSLFIILAIAAVLDNFADIPAVTHAFAGIRIAVAALIASAVVKLFKGGVLQKQAAERKGNIKMLLLLNTTPVVLCVAAFTLVAFFGISPVYVVAGSAAFGLLFYGKRVDK